MPIPLTVLSSDALVSWVPLLQPFAAWLHFDREWGPSEEAAVANIIKGGCRVIMVTGASCEMIEDLIDSIVMDVTDDMVLTFSAVNLNEDSAFDFLITRCPDSSCKFRIISSFSDSIGTELKQIIRMNEAITLAGSYPAKE